MCSTGKYSNVSTEIYIFLFKSVWCIYLSFGRKLKTRIGRFSWPAENLKADEDVANAGATGDMAPLLLRWFNFNPSMDK